MAADIKAPNYPESIQEGTLSTWHKSEGDAVERDELIVEIETDNYKSNLTFGAGDTEVDLLESVCVQHEIDHLNGMRILDRAMQLTIRRDKPKIGRNQLVTIKKGDEVQTLKYKKTQKFLDDGWVIK